MVIVSTSIRANASGPSVSTTYSMPAVRRATRAATSSVAYVGGPPSVRTIAPVATRTGSGRRLKRQRDARALGGGEQVRGRRARSSKHTVDEAAHQRADDVEAAA